MDASAPEPFVTIPLRYENAFGGTVQTQDGGVVAQEPRNPVGCGLYLHQKGAMDQRLPNLEDPENRITSWDGAAIPSSYGPIPAGWQPRLGLAGTYDKQWVDERIPLWPQDINPRFFCAATPDLIVSARLGFGPRAARLP